MTVYPSAFDSDLEIPRVEQNVTEISGNIINSLHDAIFAVQSVIGLNAQGNKATFVERMNVSIDANGNIKSGALDGIGLLELPVVDRHVGITAGIQESKLALDHSTSSLSNSISSLSTDVVGLSEGLTSVVAGLNTHILGQGSYHDGYSVKINLASQIGIAGMDAVTVGDALNEFGSILISGSDSIVPHIDLNMPSSVKHRSSEISVDASSFTMISRTSQNVQEAFDSLDEQSGILGVDHIDKFHTNGILKEINSNTYYNADLNLLGPKSGAMYSEGTGVIQIPDVTSFSDLGITTGDILVIEEDSDIVDSGIYQIGAVGPLTNSDTLGDFPTLAVNELFVLHTFVESRSAGDDVIVNIYRPSAISSKYAPLACSVRNNETLVDTVSILNPGAAHVVSVGFNGAILSSDGYSIGIRVGIDALEYRNLVIPSLHFEKLGTNRADPVDAESVAERINAFVSDPDFNHHFPITAFRIGNELAIAHNWVGANYTVEIIDGYTGNFPLGLDAYGANIVGEETIGSISGAYSINGVELASLCTAFDGYASIESDSSTFSLWTNSGQMINPLRYGIGPGSVLHVSEHVTQDTNGSYTLFTATSTSISLFGAEVIDAPNSPTVFDVKFTHSNVSLSLLESTETNMGLAQVVVDSSGKTFLHQKLIYSTNFGSAFEISNVSGTFPVGDVSVLSTTSGDFTDFNIIDDTISGPTTRILSDFKGSFKLYHPNGLDYLNISILPGTVFAGIETVTVNHSIPQDQAFLLCTVHFNGTLSVTNLVDDRLFGNLGSMQIRDDFIEIFSQKPVSDLRSDGIVRGFDLMDVLYLDTVTNMQAVPIMGGVAYVNGVRVAVETQKVTIQSYDESGNTISGDRIIGINDFGSIQVVEDELGEILTDGYNASAAFGKILPLYCITVTNGIPGNIIDVRRFINNIDEKIDVVVDESNNVVGNFRSLEGALLYAEKYPNSERLTVRIINSVTPQNSITIPDGISILGDAPYGGNSKHQIVNNSNRNQDFITLLGNNRLENIEIVSTTAGLQGSLVAISGGNINIEKCSLKFVDTISSNSSDFGIRIDSGNNVRIVNNRISNTFTGVSSEFGSDNLIIADNLITGISGIGFGYGVVIGPNSVSISNTSITNNIIELDAVSNTDLRGIYVDVDEPIETMRISENTISCALDINSKNYLSNGIRVTNSNDSGNKIAQLMVTNNHIKDVRLHDLSVFAIYVGDVGRALIANNTIENVGVYDVNYSSIAYIWVDDDVDLVEIHNNILSDGESRNGIYVKNSSTLTSIVSNTLKNIGETSADYIYGNAHRSVVSNNKLIGPGNYGIWWKGTQSKISNNHIGSDGVDYAFKTGILAQASYVDIDNNTVIDMFDEGSVGIANASSANEGIKITGNTVIGDTMSKLVDLIGNYHVVSGNRLRNDTKSAGGETYFINLAPTADGVAITGNIFDGDNASGAIGTAYVYSSGAVTNISITNNLMLAANASNTLTSAPIRLSDSGVSDCFVSGNKLPPKASYPSADNIIGLTPAFETYNDNTVGVNRGLLDTRSIHACEGTTAYHSGGNPFWIFNGSGAYWEVNPLTVDSEIRYLYMPISGLPNGSKLESAEIQGKDTAQASVTFTAQIFKKRVKVSGLTVTAISSAKDLSSASGEFGNDGNIGLVPTTSDEIINYEESSYYVQILHSRDAPTTPEDIRIYGMTLVFRY